MPVLRSTLRLPKRKFDYNVNNVVVTFMVIIYNVCGVNCKLFCRTIPNKYNYDCMASFKSIDTNNPKYDKVINKFERVQFFFFFFLSPDSVSRHDPFCHTIFRHWMMVPFPAEQGLGLHPGPRSPGPYLTPG